MAVEVQTGEMGVRHVQVFAGCNFVDNHLLDSIPGFMAEVAQPALEESHVRLGKIHRWSAEQTGLNWDPVSVSWRTNLRTPVGTNKGPPRRAGETQGFYVRPEAIADGSLTVVAN